MKELFLFALAVIVVSVWPAAFYIGIAVYVVYIFCTFIDDHAKERDEKFREIVREELREERRNRY